jgi:hypothetical protein
VSSGRTLPALTDANSAGRLDISYALASIRTGTLIDTLGMGEPSAQLEGLAATLPELFGTVDPSCLARLSDRLGGSGGGTFAEILLISPEHTHVIQPLLGRPGVALLAVSPEAGKIGFVLSAVRTHSDSLEGE